MGQSRPLFLWISSVSYSNIKFNHTNWKSVDIVHGIWTWGCRMVGADETTELWRPPCDGLMFVRALSAFRFLSPSLLVSLLRWPLQGHGDLSFRIIALFRSGLQNQITCLPLSLSRRTISWFWFKIKLIELS